ncbi:23630_t:CDS:2, partial [Cetraspora pellucida]
MDNASSSSTSCIKSKITWCPLLPNIQCIQVLLINVLLVLNLYTFDVTFSEDGTLSKGYDILLQDHTNKGQVCTIMDTYESKETAILKQYGVKDSQNPKEQAVLL